MKKFITVFLFIVCFNFTTSAQYYSADAAKSSQKQSKGWDWNKVYPGGNVGLGFGKGYFYGEISPLAGYWVNNWFTPGVMLTYIYMNYSSINFQSNVFGVSPFARAFVLDWLFFHIETGFFTGKGIIQDAKTENILVPFRYENRFLFAPLVGGGVNFGLGKRGGFVIMALYNLNYQSDFFLPGVNQRFTLRVGFYL